MHHSTASSPLNPSSRPQQLTSVMITDESGEHSIKSAENLRVMCLALQKLIAKLSCPSVS